MSEVENEDRVDFADEYRKADRCVYRECETWGCVNEAEWQADADGSWWCSECAK